MPFIGNQPAKVPLTSADITDGIITNADIANSTINLTQKVTGALPVANGGTGLTALGTANQELRVNSGATALEYYTPTVASSDYVRLATTTISSGVTSVELTTGFSDTYKIYALYIMGVTVATNAALLKLQFGTGVGPTYATSSYKGADYIVSVNVDVGSPAFAGGNNISDCINLNGPNGTANNSAYNYNATVILNNLRSTATLYKHAYVYGHHIQTTDVWQTIWSQGYNNGATVTNAAVTGIKILTSSGNMNTGTFVLYGIKTA